MFSSFSYPVISYTTSDSDIELVGIGAFGVYLSLLGDTVIDVGAGSFSVQKVGASSGGQLFSNGGPYDLSITAAGYLGAGRHGY